ncbi:unnamed protein product [Lota lota]
MRYPLQRVRRQGTAARTSERARKYRGESRWQAYVRHLGLPTIPLCCTAAQTLTSSQAAKSPRANVCVDEERQVALEEPQEMQEGDEDRNPFWIILQYPEDMALCVDSCAYVKNLQITCMFEYPGQEMNLQ